MKMANNCPVDGSFLDAGFKCSVCGRQWERTKSRSGKSTIWKEIRPRGPLHEDFNLRELVQKIADKVGVE